MTDDQPVTIDSERQQPARRRRRQSRRSNKRRRLKMIAAIVLAMLFTAIMVAVFMFGEAGDGTPTG